MFICSKSASNYQLLYTKVVTVLDFSSNSTKYSYSDNDYPVPLITEDVIHYLPFNDIFRANLNKT